MDFWYLVSGICAFLDNLSLLGQNMRKHRKHIRNTYETYTKRIRNIFDAYTRHVRHVYENKYETSPKHIGTPTRAHVVSMMRVCNMFSQRTWEHMYSRIQHTRRNTFNHRMKRLWRIGWAPHESDDRVVTKCSKSYSITNETHTKKWTTYTHVLVTAIVIICTTIIIGWRWWSI